MGERSFLVIVHGQAFSELKIPHDTVLEAGFAVLVNRWVMHRKNVFAAGRRMRV